MGRGIFPRKVSKGPARVQESKPSPRKSILFGSRIVDIEGNLECYVQVLF